MPCMAAATIEPDHEAVVPERLPAFRAPAELEGDAAEDEAEQHEDDRHVERGQHGGVGQREDRHQAAAAEDEPGLVAVPDRGDRVGHHVAVVLFGEEREEDADAEIEAVEDDVGEHREGDEAGPDEGEIKLHR